MKTLQNLLVGGCLGLVVYVFAGCTVQNPDYCDNGCEPIPPSCAGEACVPPTPVPVDPPLVDGPCEGDEDCASTAYCGGDARCVPRCKSDEECSHGEVCIECGKCQSPALPATCGAAPDFCQADGDCGVGKACRVGRCHFECSSESTCPVGQVCAEGLCADDPAPASPECTLDLHCESGTCINGYCHVYCESQADCGDMMVCQIAVCQPDYQPSR
ncbi:MAG: hypothetical protein JRH20_21560 [Deltaproteobacteria bacterium]|nr:hypothetical protein [Deltaproteobacteria bacterium]